MNSIMCLCQERMSAEGAKERATMHKCGTSRGCHPIKLVSIFGKHAHIMTPSDVTGPALVF